MYATTTKTIMLISGVFVSHHYWEEWIVFLEKRGYKVVAPPWLYKNDSTENLRMQNQTQKIGTITLSDLLCYYTEIIEILPEKPILIGHSYGGLLVQLLIQKDLASAGICINSFPPSGFTFSKLTFYKTIFGLSTNLISLKKTHKLSFKKWQHIFFNSVSYYEQSTKYEKYSIPESQKVLRDLFSKKAVINFKKRHSPLLLISCSQDKIVSPKLIYWNFKKYRNVHSLTCYKNFDDRNHFVVLEPHWKETASHIVQWLDKIS